MTMTFTTTDGDFAFDRACDILVDTTDGYLNTYEEIQYKSDSTTLMDLFSGGTEDPDVDRNVVGSRLLKTLSSMHSIALDGRSMHGEIKEDEKKYVIHRLAKLAPVVSKLSDQYAQENQLYAAHYNEDIIALCQAITDAHDPGESIPPSHSEDS